MGVMRTFLPAWTKGPVVAQAPWDNPPLDLWRGGVPICDLFGVNKTPTKVDDLGRDLWLSSVLSRPSRSCMVPTSNQRGSK